MASAKILNINQVYQKIIEEFGRKSVPIILEQAAIAAKPHIASLLVESFYNTEFYRYLVQNAGGGTGSETDFRAIFGLSNESAILAGEAIADILSNIFDGIEVSSINLETGRKNKFGTTSAIQFTINAGALKDRLLSENFASYLSNNTNLVPWLEYFLSGGETPGYQLVYSSSGRLNNYSRSSNAIMVESTEGDYWQFDANDAVFTESGDFLTDLTANTDFLSKAGVVLRKEITREAKAYEGII